jgi:hypothetical protein
VPLSATSYFAGMGTVVAALTVGFTGGLMITGPSKNAEIPNRLQRVMSNAPLPDPNLRVAEAKKLDAPEAAPSATPKQAERTAVETERVSVENSNGSRVQEADVRLPLKPGEPTTWAERKRGQQRTEPGRVAVKCVNQSCVIQAVSKASDK